MFKSGPAALGGLAQKPAWGRCPWVMIESDRSNQRNRLGGRWGV